LETWRRTIKTDLSIEISKIVSSLKVNELLKNHTTFRVGGPAAYFADVADIKELQQLYKFSIGRKLPLFIIGSGSNILFGDKGFDGIVARLMGDFCAYRFQKETVFAGAGVKTAALVSACAENGLSGLEGLAGIPGTLGGALVGNAGTSGGWIGDAVKSVEVLAASGRVRMIPREKINFAYRGSDLRDKLVLGAVLHLKKAPKNDIVTGIEKLLCRRNETQPVGTHNAGSVFKNPPEDSAGRLIDACGLKGFSIGGAEVSEKHANFIINKGNATASDIKALITSVRQKVKEKSGIELELEIKLAGQ
jgi:UDP-N-acetylmuramate dehydrogenase